MHLQSAVRMPLPARVGVHRVTAKPRNGVIFITMAVLLVFNIALAKAGFTAGGTPVTFGYILLGAAAPFALIGLVRRSVLSPSAFVHLLIGYLPIGLLALYKIQTYTASPVALLVMGTVFLLLPAIILGILSPYLEDLTEAQILSVLKWCVRFAVAWGLLNFTLYFLTKQFIAIPYLTMNAADAAEVFSKNNRRGPLMKLVSTYNNGNIFGVCMIMLGPLYIYAENKKSWVAAFIVAIMLTLSRSAWAGLLLMGAMMVVVGQLKINRGPLWIAILVVAALLMTIMPLLGWTSDNLFDANLGGRLHQISDLQWTWWGAQRIQISEILYAGLLQSFGVAGGLLALLALGMGALYGFSNFQRLSMLRKAALAGLLCYLGIAASDAAFIFPPTMATFLFLNAMVYRRGYRGAIPGRPNPATAARG